MNKHVLKKGLYILFIELIILSSCAKNNANYMSNSKKKINEIAEEKFLSKFTKPFNKLSKKERLEITRFYNNQHTEEKISNHLEKCISCQNEIKKYKSNLILLNHKHPYWGNRYQKWIKASKKCQILSETIAGTDIQRFCKDYITKIVIYNYCKNLDKLFIPNCIIESILNYSYILKRQNYSVEVFANGYNLFFPYYKDKSIEITNIYRSLSKNYDSKLFFNKEEISMHEAENYDWEISNNIRYLCCKKPNELILCDLSLDKIILNKKNSETSFMKFGSDNQYFLYDNKGEIKFYDIKNSTCLILGKHENLFLLDFFKNNKTLISANKKSICFWRTDIHKDLNKNNNIFCKEISSKPQLTNLSEEKEQNDDFFCNDEKAWKNKSLLGYYINNDPNFFNKTIAINKSYEKLAICYYKNDIKNKNYKEYYIKIFEINNNKNPLILKFERQKENIEEISFAKNNTKFLIKFSNRIIIWDYINDLKKEINFQDHYCNSIHNKEHSIFSISSDGKMLAFADGSFLIIKDIETNNIINILGDGGEILKIFFDGNYIWTNNIGRENSRYEIDFYNNSL